MYTQTLYELSQEAETPVTAFSPTVAVTGKNASLCTRRRRATTGFTLESA